MIARWIGRRLLAVGLLVAVAAGLGFGTYFGLVRGAEIVAERVETALAPIASPITVVGQTVESVPERLAQLVPGGGGG